MTIQQSSINSGSNDTSSSHYNGMEGEAVVQDPLEVCITYQLKKKAVFSCLFILMQCKLITQERLFIFFRSSSQASISTGSVKCLNVILFTFVVDQIFCCLQILISIRNDPQSFSKFNFFAILFFFFQILKKKNCIFNISFEFD